MNNKYGLTGRGVGIAMLDTGIFPHIDFDNRIICFRDFLYGRKQPYDDNGHGTHTAGIAAGSGIGSNGQYPGVAPGSQLIALKVLDRKGNGQKRDVLRALESVSYTHLDVYKRQLLMERNHMTESEAHRYIQKCSMDNGTNLVETAQMVLTLMSC